jgi:hypothetical protein
MQNQNGSCCGGSMNLMQLATYPPVGIPEVSHLPHIMMMPETLNLQDGSHSIVTAKPSSYAANCNLPAAPEDSFQKSMQAQTLNATTTSSYYDNPCSISIVPDQHEQQSGTSGTMACLLHLPEVSSATAAVGPSPQLLFNALNPMQHQQQQQQQQQQQWEHHNPMVVVPICCTESDSIATAEHHSGGRQNHELDLIEFVDRPLDTTYYMERVKLSTAPEVGSYSLNVPHLWGGGGGGGGGNGGDGCGQLCIKGIDYPGHDTPLAEAKLREICHQMHAQWQLGCIGLGHR